MPIVELTTGFFLLEQSSCVHRKAISDNSFCLRSSCVTTCTQCNCQKVAQLFRPSPEWDRIRKDLITIGIASPYVNYDYTAFLSEEDWQDLLNLVQEVKPNRDALNERLLSEFAAFGGSEPPAARYRRLWRRIRRLFGR